jgi:dihydrolipoamide dehydrogenase
MEEAEGGVKVTVQPEGGEATSETYEKVLVAVGRTPNTRDIGLEALGIETDKRGFIGVDRQMKTSAPNVYAIGDVAGEPMLAHKAQPRRAHRSR